MSAVAASNAESALAQAPSPRIDPSEWLVLWTIVLIWLTSLVVGFQWGLVALVLISGGAAIAGLVRPRLGLVGVGMLCALDAPARVFLFTGGWWRWNTLNYGLLIVILLFLPQVVRWKDAPTRALELLIALLVAGLVVSPDIRGGLQHILAIGSAFGVMVYFHRCRSDARALYSLAVVCGTMSAIGAVVFLVQKSALPYINPNAFVYFPLAGLFAICLGFPNARQQSRGQVGLCLLAAANLASVFLSGSRGGLLIGVTCALSLTVAVRGLNARIMGIVAAMLVAIGVSSQFSDLQAHTLHRLGKLVNPRYSLTSRTSGRYDLAVGALYMVRSEPLGVGTGGFAARWRDLGDLPGLSRFRRGEEVAAHSGWAKILAENGIPGLLLLTAYTVSFAAVGVRRRHAGMLGLGVLCTLALAMAFVSTEFQGKPIWLLAAGVATLLRRENRSPVLDANGSSARNDRALRRSPSR